MSPDNPTKLNVLREEDHAIQLAINALDDELATLGEGTIRKLKQSRKQALKSSNRFTLFDTLHNRSNLVSACASVAAVLVMVALFMPADTVDSHNQDVRMQRTELPDGFNHEDMEFYGTVDFLLWLEQQRV